jgi:checkpoint serine/threonine-protein kinase
MNEDSISSYNGDQNSFFQAENDDDFKGRRLEKAIATIDEHLKRRDVDPFNSELCRAFLIKLNFPNREPTTDYKITSMNLPKLLKNQLVPLGGVSYQIEKEVGRGSYGAVFRAINTNDGAVVALKYQKPPNSWELYICTEVKKRLKNIDVVS